MARRRRSITPAEKPQLFDCDAAIAKMERAVVYRTVDRTRFSADDILDMLVPEEHLRRLRAAYPYMQNPSIGPSWDAHLRIGDTDMRIQMTTVAVQCLTPHDVHAPGGSPFQPTAAGPTVMSALVEIVETVHEHNVLRRVVAWLNDNKATPGFARHYCPALGALLPNDHPFHQTDGQRYRDQFMPHDAVSDFRRAPEIITKGLFCRPDDHAYLDGKTYCTVYVDQATIPLFAKDAW